MDIDVLVAGAGPAGSATAVALARLGVRVLLTDGPRNHRHWAGESLPPGTGKLVASLFGPDILAVPPHQVAYGTRSLWGSTQVTETNFLDNPLGTGWLVDRHRFDAQLVQSAVNQGVRLVNGASVSGIRRQEECWEVSFHQTSTIKVPWLVDATGRSGFVLRHLGIRRKRRDQQVAQISVLPDSNTAQTFLGTTVEAVSGGWWYTTPLPGEKRVVAYLTDRDLMAPGNDRTGQWRCRLQETLYMKDLVGTTANVASVSLYPADTTYRRQIYGKGWVAVGDAAMTLDPLSSQGIVTSLLMGARAGHAITGALNDGGVDALESWARDYRMLFEEHESMRNFYASMETRWSDAIYWRRRRQ